MKYFDESIFTIKYSSESYLGNTISVEINVNDKFSSEAYKTTRKEFEKNLEFVTEWVILDPKDSEFSKVCKGSELYLDESTYEKQIMVHTIVKSDVFSYQGMPFQKSYKSIEIDPKRLSETIEMIYQTQMIPNLNEVDRIYKHFAQVLVDFNSEINKRFKFIIKAENSEFLFDLYKKERQLESDVKKIKNLNEERIFWKNQCETVQEELHKVKSEIQKLSLKNQHLTEQNEVLLEEKNYFMNSKWFKNTNEFSFLDEKSQDLNQTAFLNIMGKDNLPTIPALLNTINNNTLDLTINDEEFCQNEAQREIRNLREKIADYENIIKNYRREIENFRRLYSQHKIDSLINENKQIKVKTNSMQNQLDEYKSKLMKYDFAYKYISKEFESMKGFTSFFNNRGPDESFITASNVTANLTKELIERDKKIEKLEQALQQIKNEVYHNHSF